MRGMVNGTGVPTSSGQHQHMCISDSSRNIADILERLHHTADKMRLDSGLWSLLVHQIPGTI